MSIIHVSVIVLLCRIILGHQAWILPSVGTAISTQIYPWSAIATWELLICNLQFHFLVIAFNRAVNIELCHPTCILGMTIRGYSWHDNRMWPMVSSLWPHFLHIALILIAIVFQAQLLVSKVPSCAVTMRAPVVAFTQLSQSHNEELVWSIHSLSRGAPLMIFVLSALSNVSFWHLTSCLFGAVHHFVAYPYHTSQYCSTHKYWIGEVSSWYAYQMS